MPELELNWLTPHWASLAGRLERLPHALLLRGPRGIGKLVLARRLAQALLCETPGTARPCGVCDGCRWFAAGSHPDFREVMLDTDEGESEEGGDTKSKRAPTQIRIGQIRALDAFVEVSAHRPGGKVILLQPAEALNTAAASALLKMLEEPPPDTRFILVSHRTGGVLPTILSRCEKIAIGLPPGDEAEAWLQGRVEQPALALAQAGGAPLLAAEYDDADWWKQRREFLTLLADREFAPLAVAERVRSFPVDRLVGWLQRWAYDLAAAAGGAGILFNPDFARELEALGGGTGPVAAGRFYRLSTRAQRAVDHPLNAQLFIEQLMLEYAAARSGRALAA
ncbi:MAG: DNA polymerase III subunit delta' [Burkholderiales bacterium]